MKRVKSILSMLFNQFPDFKEMRLMSNRHDIAFIHTPTCTYIVYSRGHTFVTYLF